MNKRISTVFALLLLAGGVMAQSIDDGLKKLYYGKYAGAKQDFESVIASKPTDDRAHYYLGIAELGMENQEAAAAAFTKGLTAVPNSPLLTAGMGRIDLLNGDTAAARQKFDAALAGVKGKNGEVSRAVADANSEIKGGNKAFALATMETLMNNEGAKRRDIYDATAADYIELGDAYRALGGENGGKAITAYERALELDANNAEAVMKQGHVNYNAKLLEQAVGDYARAASLDPNYAPVFYELYQFYYTPRPRQFSLAKAKENLQKYLSLSDPSDKVKNEYYLASIMFFDRDYDSAIAKAQSLIPQANDSYKMKLHRLIADAHLQKGDSLTARKVYDDYVQKVGEAKLEPLDYKLGSEIYGRIKYQDSASQVEIDNKALEYLEKYATADTVKDLDRYESVAKAYQEARVFDRAADWYKKFAELKVEMKEKPSALDYYNIGLNYYRASAGEGMTDTVMLNKADSAFGQISTNFPDLTTGHYWQGMTAAGKDVEAKTGVALPYFEKYIAMAESDVERNKIGLIKAYTYLMVYYYNKEDNANLQKYMSKLEPLDPNSEPVRAIKENMSARSAQQNSTK
ncbi:tetratricopeptide repeat protein [Chitinophaga sp. XS-30]|uniref:tetratricopeptide repeat protein n=1 Tax=Chitinophaga sp. XS-30 TaxID=2604421 RepID=UPI0011DCA912|nr:tetratricopeptide repeat protein [Chitinophaga sp. XS-30]QEH43776.1 tetratricopeptide repeat protein [Chitinophaga sp. XS-30]